MKKMLFALRDLTARGEQVWSPAPGRSGPNFQTKVGSWTVEICSVDEDGQAPYRLGIIGDQRELIESIDTRPIRPAMSGEVRQELRPQNLALRELFEAARRQATGVDAALDEITKILEQK